ncbi:MAG: hypothetical protein IKT35_04565, partial [Clostridia bacterium]|nr:hypothetical protein [Clostridia bacterium]
MIQFKRKIECALALVLSLVILLSVIPVSWVSSEEYTSSVLTTNIGDSTLAVNQVSEFTVTTEANDDVNKMVVGTIKFSDPEAVESLEYHAEDGENGWVAITEGFKAEEGFALADETIEFRVVINKTGNFTVEVTINDFNDGSEVSKVSAEFVVDQAEITDVTVEPVSVPYDGSELLLANIQGIKEGDVVTCKINDEIVDSIEDLKGVSVGNYEITVTVDRGPDYKLFEKTVISSIVLGNLELGDIRIKGIEEVYTGDAYEAVIVTRPENSDYTLEYSLDGGEWSDIIPTVIDA